MSGLKEYLSINMLKATGWVGVLSGVFSQK